VTKGWDTKAELRYLPALMCPESLSWCHTGVSFTEGKREEESPGVAALKGAGPEPWRGKLQLLV